MRKFLLLFTLTVLLWELLDPSTSFVRRTDVSPSQPTKMDSSVSVKKRVTTSLASDAIQLGEPDEGNLRSPLFDADTIHYCCAVMIFAFDVEPAARLLFLGEAEDPLSGPAVSIYQPPKRA